MPRATSNFFVKTILNSPFHGLLGRNFAVINLKGRRSGKVLPERGRLKLSCEVGAAALTVIVPEGIAIRARATIGAGDFHVDKTRFPNNESADFASAQNALDIHVTGGAASVRIK